MARTNRVLIPEARKGIEVDLKERKIEIYKDLKWK